MSSKHNQKKAKKALTSSKRKESTAVATSSRAAKKSRTHHAATPDIHPTHGTSEAEEEGDATTHHDNRAIEITDGSVHSISPIRQELEASDAELG